MDEREFELINIIGPKLGANQRDLSRQMDLSLGMVNMLMRRLVSKGYIRIKQLNKRKVQYILTPKGIAEQMRKSVKYTLKTINSIGLINDRLRESLNEVVQKGEREFVILGSSDFAILVKNIVRELCIEDCLITHVEELPKDKLNGTLLICKECDLVNGHINNEPIKRSWGAGLPHQNSMIFNAAGGLHTEAKSYAKFITSIIQGRGLYPETFKDMLSPQTEIPKENPNYIEDGITSWSLGFGIRPLQSDTIYRHGGSNSDFQSEMAFSINKKIGYVFFVNCEKGNEFNENLESYLGMAE